MDAGLFPASVNVALTHGIKHKHVFIFEVGASTVSFGKEAGRALIAVTAIVAITSIIKTFISRPVIVQQAAPVDRLYWEQLSRDKRQRKEGSTKRESSSDNAIATASATRIEAPVATEAPVVDENVDKDPSAAAV